MEQVKWKSEKVIDAHVHFRDREPVEHFEKILSLVDYTKINILAGTDRARLERKRAHPDTVYMFAMMKQEPDKIADGDGGYLVDELERILAMGYDGIKMMDGKPSNRRTWMPLSIDHEYFRPYWDRAEEIDVPITIHVADPVEYWAPGREGSYEDLDPQEEFFRQTIAVLERNPDLRITFAHFLFMGPQLDRLGELFSRFPKMRVDMAMGHEFLYYLSDDPEKARDFYIKWQDRILYGTDISDHNSLRLARAKAETLRLFLETDETFVNLTAEAMDRPTIVGSNGRVELHGLNLPQEVLEKVLWRNFEAFADQTPKPLP